MEKLGYEAIALPHTQFVCMKNDLGTMLLKVYILREYFRVITFVQCFFFRAFKIGGNWGDNSPPPKQ